MKKPNSAAPTALTISTLLLLSLFLVSIPKVESASLAPVTDRNRVYVENADCYISAAPHTLNGDGYVYFNITSKTYQGEVAFCFGFSGNPGYPTSLELYDRREETTRHELDLSPYFDDSACQVGYNYSGKAGEVVYDGYVWGLSPRQLYYPTKGSWMDNPQGGGVMKCYMRVWGDGNLVIPC